MFQNTLWMYIETQVCGSVSCWCQSDDCFESYTERELQRKITYFKEL